MDLWQLVVAAIGVLVGVAAISSTMATWVVMSVRAATSTLAETIRGLARSLDHLREEFHAQRARVDSLDRKVARLGGRNGDDEGD